MTHEFIAFVPLSKILSLVVPDLTSILGNLFLKLEWKENVFDHIMDERGVDDESCDISNETVIYSQPVLGT